VYQFAEDCAAGILLPFMFLLFDNDHRFIALIIKSRRCSWQLLTSLEKNNAVFKGTHTQ